MPQFDVHTSRGRSRTGVPFLVNVQTRRLDSIPTRLVMPLKLVGSAHVMRGDFIVEFSGERFFLRPEQMFAILRRSLGEVVGSVAEQSETFIDAIDQVITTVYR